MIGLPAIRSSVRSIRAGDFSGAFGDLGTFLPLWLALVVVCGLDPAASLVLAGAANIATGLLFRVPMAVQPMKAIAAVAIGIGFGPGSIAAAGITMGVIMLLMGGTRLMDRVAGIVPMPVVRGVQWVVAVKLFIAGARVMMDDQQTQSLLGSSYAPLLGLLLLGALLAVYFRKTIPVTVVLLTSCGVLGYYFWDRAGAVIQESPAWMPVLPNLGNFQEGFLHAVIPQIPMTMLNSVVAVTALGVSLFPKHKDRLGHSTISRSVGIMNLIACPLGGMPMCHGSGGLAGQYAFGARTGFSVVFLGTIKVVVGVACAAYFAGFAQFVPRSILGIWVVAAGLELLRSTIPAVNRLTVTTTVMVPAVSLLSGSLPLGVGAAWVFHKVFSVVHARWSGTG